MAESPCGCGWRWTNTRRNTLRGNESKLRMVVRSALAELLSESIEKQFFAVPGMPQLCSFGWLRRRPSAVARTFERAPTHAVWLTHAKRPDAHGVIGTCRPFDAKAADRRRGGNGKCGEGASDGGHSPGSNSDHAAPPLALSLWWWRRHCSGDGIPSIGGKRWPCSTNAPVQPAPPTCARRRR